nr:hypothetical protein [Acidimicrobiia bacterium]
MSVDPVQAKLLAQAVYEIRLLLGGYLGSTNPGKLEVRQAAHLAYALHNEALSVLHGREFDPTAAITAIRRTDAMLGADLSPRFARHLPQED